MTPDKMADFHTSQIDMVLARTRHDQNIAWTASVVTAVQAMEKGVSAMLMPTRQARAVLQNAMSARQAEPAASNRWHISCIVESLATLRVLSLQNPDLRDCYRMSRDRVINGLPPLD